MISVLLLCGLFAIFIALPLLIYTFLVFPNLDGVMHNISWYKYDDNSQHFLYWLGFWSIVLFGSRSITSGSKKQ